MTSLYLLLLALVVAAPPAGAAPKTQFLVVPGRSMGPVVIGMRLQAVEGILGRPTKVDASGPTQWYEWKDPENRFRSIAVETLQNGVVLISLAHDPRFRTIDGLGDGTPLADVERVLGRPSSVLNLGGFSIAQYRRTGIGFVTDGSGRVTGIVVAPGV
ncbi:MAG TPA: hypothetical protein VJT33_09780 [bacterium]|nr:hypothetical protein [bacterium]